MEGHLVGDTCPGDETEPGNPSFDEQSSKVA